MHFRAITLPLILCMALVCSIKVIIIDKSSYRLRLLTSSDYLSTVFAAVLLSGSFLSRL